MAAAAASEGVVVVVVGEAPLSSSHMEATEAEPQ